jgi:predicted histone-like DNA-binding protein
MQFRVIKRGEPGVKGGGNQKYFAGIAINGEITIDDMVVEIEKFSALSEPDIRGVIIAVENVIQKALADTKIVRMEKLGTFYPNLRSEGKEKEEEVNQTVIKSIHVNYRPGKRILDAMKNKGFKKVADKK